jgi:hypothetical protein
MREGLPNEGAIHAPKQSLDVEHDSKFLGFLLKDKDAPVLIPVK